MVTPLEVLHLKPHIGMLQSHVVSNRIWVRERPATRGNWASRGVAWVVIVDVSSDGQQIWQHCIAQRTLITSCNPTTRQKPNILV